ncbi:peptide MFS transporter [Lachnospiraceae bacterium 42-17]|nr:peptide MFS transporter [Dorea sp.]
MGQTQVKQKHPKGFYSCCITFTFERLAFYGAKPLLLLFLITAVAEGGLGVERTDAAVMAANLTAYTYMAPLIGGIICDRWLGARYAITLGYIIMALGYVVGWKAQSPAMVNAMIILVSIGTGFFKGNLNALIGRQYKSKELLDAAFSIQYSYVNIGAFVGSLLTGYLYLHLFRKGDVLGFRQCLLMAALWCVVGAVWFVFNWKNLQGQGIKPFKYLTDEKGNIIGSTENDKSSNGKKDEPLTKLEKNRVLAIVLVSAFSVLFWLFYYQQDLALVIYMTDYVKMSIGSFEIPPSWITTTWNGLLCVALGGVMAAIWKKLAARPQGDLNMFKKVSLSFLFVGLAFGIMVACESIRGVGSPASVKASVLWPFLFSTVITVGEMCFSPLRNSFVSKYAPKKYVSLLMGVIAVSTFGANKLSPFVQAFIEKFDVFPVFVGIFALMLVFAALIWMVNGKLNSLVEGKAEN